MKFLIDQNISHRVIHHIKDHYLDITHVKNIGLTDATDSEVWDFAYQNGYNIITQDSDFNDLLNRYGAPPKIVWLRVGNLSSVQMAQILINHKDEIMQFIADNEYGIIEIYS